MQPKYPEIEQYGDAYQTARNEILRAGRLMDTLIAERKSIPLLLQRAEELLECADSGDSDGLYQSAIPSLRSAVERATGAQARRDQDDNFSEGQ